jgi:hypothetical protein
MPVNHFQKSGSLPPVERTRIETPDTIIISAKEESFYGVFLMEQCWYPIRIGSEKLESIKWIAVYQTAPVSAITHFAKIDRIVDYQDTGRYKIVFDEPLELPVPISLGESRKKTFQGQRYTTLEKLKCARLIEDLKPWV